MANLKLGLKGGCNFWCTTYQSYNMFNQFHGDQIYRRHRQIEKTVQAILEQDSFFPAEVVKLFVNVRF